MPISDRAGAGRRRTLPALVASLALLAGCQMTVPGQAGGAASGNALRSATLDGGTITIRGPAGYCIDAKSLRASGPRQFALLAPCDLLTSGQINGVSSLSILTVTAVRSSGETPLPTPAQIAETFGPASVLSHSTRNGALLVQLSDGGQRASKNASPVHWRGVMQVPGHTLGLAAYGSEGGRASGSGGRDLLLSLVAGIRDATSGRTTGDTVAVQKPAD